LKKIPLLAFAFAILWLFFIQSAGTLVESIYILDLLNTQLDEKALGVLFFFAPLLALPWFRRSPRVLAWVLFAALLFARGLMPYVTTANRVLPAGIATAAALALLLLLLAGKPVAGGRSLSAAIGLALATGLSVVLRSVYFGVEYALTPAGGWVGVVLGLLLGGLLTQLDLTPAPELPPAKAPVTAPLLGLYLVLILIYFAFSAPSVIARWTQASYPLVVGTVSLLSLGWAGLVLLAPGLLERITPRGLLVWNALFTLSLTATLLAQRVPFPPALTSPEVVVGAPTFWQQVPLVFMLLLFPVLFLDVHVLTRRLEGGLSPSRLVPGVLLGGLLWILLVFAHIFTNVWGYIEPVSPPFRNAFWLPHLLPAAGVCLLAWLARKPAGSESTAQSYPFAWTALLVSLFLVTMIGAWPRPRIQEDSAAKTSLRVMTYNTQQFNDEAGEKAIDRQVALARSVSPDVLVLQESDSNRISLNNNDYVRYFAERLGYYSYYGPTPVTGTYGTAILSKFPLENPRSVFIFSDKDETGVAEADVILGGQRFTIFNVHPDSSDPAMLVFAQTLVRRAQGQANAIALGDYNLRDTEEAYQVIDAALVNAWTSVYPSKISPDGMDMSGRNRIDHIFLSPHLQAVNPIYVLPPDSATDHPVHWSDITWAQ